MCSHPGLSAVKARLGGFLALDALDSAPALVADDNATAEGMRLRTDFTQASRLAMAWIDIVCAGEARIVREATIAKPYGWVFYYQSKEFLDEGIASAQLAGNAPILVDRHTFELRVTGTAKPLEQYLKDYEKSLPSGVFPRAPQPHLDNRRSVVLPDCALASC